MESSKRILLTMVMFVMLTTSVSAQTLSEWLRQKRTQIEYYTRQIAALKRYNDLVREGYSIVRDGLQVTHDVRQREFDLHDRYFRSLRMVNGSFKTNESVKVYADILTECKVVRSLSERLPLGQGQHAQRVIKALQQKANQTYNQYERLTADEQYQLSDDERMRGINTTINALHDQYAFIKRLYSVLRQLILQESRESNDATRLQKIYLP